MPATAERIATLTAEALSARYFDETYDTARAALRAPVTALGAIVNEAKSWYVHGCDLAEPVLDATNRVNVLDAVKTMVDRLKPEERVGFLHFTGTQHFTKQEADAGEALRALKDDGAVVLVRVEFPTDESEPRFTELLSKRITRGGAR